ncbi:Glutathione-regulated potassium-efflux system protein KefC [compost metagenome]
MLFVGLFMISRWLLPKLFHEIAASRSAELFVLLALVIVMLTAWLTHLLGLSPALGAFLAGMLLGESSYRHQIEADIRPFRDILLGVFFVSIGMLIDLSIFQSHWLLIIGLTLALLLTKGVVVAVILRLNGSNSETSWRSGLALAQGGEFCFALMTQMQANSLVSKELSGLLLTATFCSMVVTPLMLRVAPAIAKRLHQTPNDEVNIDEIALQSQELHGHVIICGYGRVGQAIGRVLMGEQHRFVAVDDNPEQIQKDAAQKNVHYGDSRRPELLAALGLNRARLVVIAIDDADAAMTIIQAIRHINSTIDIIVRTQDDSQTTELKAAGATEVIPEVLESTLTLAAHTLIMLGTPKERVQLRVDDVRRNRYHLL